MIRLSPLVYNPFALHPTFKDIWPNRNNAPECDVTNYLEGLLPEDKKFIILF